MSATPPWHDDTRWRRLLRGDDCPLCAAPVESEHVCDLPFSRVIAPARACAPGYVCLIARSHVVEWADLTSADGAALMAEIQRVSAAIKRIVGATKLNILSLGNVVPHLHVHIIPRAPHDRFEGRALDPGDVAEVYPPGDHAEFVRKIGDAL